MVWMCYHWNNRRSSLKIQSPKCSQVYHWILYVWWYNCTYLIVSSIIWTLALNTFWFLINNLWLNANEFFNCKNVSNFFMITNWAHLKNDFCSLWSAPQDGGTIHSHLVIINAIYITMVCFFFFMTWDTLGEEVNHAN